MYDEAEKLWNCVAPKDLETARRILTTHEQAKDICELEVNVLVFGSNSKSTCRDGLNCVHFAAKKGQTEIINAMFEEVKDLNVETRSSQLDWTPLHYAAFAGHINTAKSLLEKGADVNSITHEGKFPLILAVSQGHRKLSVFLLQNGGDINMQDQRGYSVLHECLDISVMNSPQWTSSQQYQMVELLLMTGSDVTLADATGDTPLHFAIRSRVEARIVELILCVDKEGSHNVKKRKNSEKRAPERLVRRKNNAGQTPLLLAKDVDIIHVLLRHNADINDRSNDGRTILHHTVDCLKTVEYLLSRDANADVQDRQGRCPLHLCVNSDQLNTNVAAVLLERMRNVSAVDVAGDTAVHILSRRPRKQESCGFHDSSVRDAEHGMLAALLHKKVKLNLQNRRGQTALHLAMQAKRYDFAHMLLGVGASSNIKDGKGFTAEMLNPRWFKKYDRMMQFTPKLKEETVLSSRQVSVTMDSPAGMVTPENNEVPALVELPKWVMESETSTPDSSIDDESKLKDPEPETEVVLEPEPEPEPTTKRVTFKIPEKEKSLEPSITSSFEIPTEDKTEADVSPESIPETPPLPSPPQKTASPQDTTPTKQVKPKTKFPTFGTRRKVTSTFSMMGLFSDDDDDDDAVASETEKKQDKQETLTITRQMSSLQNEVDEVKGFLEEFSKEGVKIPTEEEKKTLELTRQITSLNKDMQDVKKLIDEFG